jgi:membrane fusion protein (multidrug efflux system)
MFPLERVGAPCRSCTAHLFKGKSMNSPFLSLPALLVVATALALTGCDQNAPGGAQAAPSSAPPEVTVVTLAPQRVAITTELPGRTWPYRIADVRPQVSGLILQRMFTEGSEVEAGQQLYQIDPATYEAAYDSARASQARFEATLKYARSVVDRRRTLVAGNWISKQDYDTAVASEQQAEADLESAKADVEMARIKLVYTKVRSPISGRIGRSSVTEGALVTAEQTTALASVQQLDPIYVDVTQSSTELLRLRRELESHRLRGAGADAAAAKLILEDGTEYRESGKLLFSEVTVNQGTGSVTLRAEFPNPKRELLPGMFVHARLEDGIVDQAILVPQQAVTRNQRGEATAMVIGADSKVELRVVTVDRAVGDRWLAADGLKVGDKVIVAGLQKVLPGVFVHAVEAAPQRQQSGALSAQ